MEMQKNVPPSYADINRTKKRQQIAFRRFVMAAAPAKDLAPHLGCDRFRLREHLSSRMTAGITWNNYGSVWVIDHIVPLRLFNLYDPAELSTVWNYRNLMPLLKEDNLHKEGDLRFSLLLLDQFDDGSEIVRKLRDRAHREVLRMGKYLQQPVNKLAKAS
jgi:5-methylcytosine-specific restriction endonuclease McrA